MRLPKQLKSALQRLLEKDPKPVSQPQRNFSRRSVTKRKSCRSERPVPETKAAEPQVEPLALETVNAPLASEWKTGSRHNETFTGINYPATSVREAERASVASCNK